ncbi:hypothetical protein PERMA_1029 [Persephonella marina EX-H1]|uniref:Uncharacterized protein n=1 Tax=Persephonella marina (strain DSM 14350 / EX-H1) TaxID=123214 RepID=C0QQ69_PERMH|nr:hypothetical protein [Persephonella marina]ACO04724.1 hypothetical protein PERMA_1029 [Persephonella marina EX-H1]
MRKLLTLVMAGLILGSASAYELKKVDDTELEDIYAQGFVLNGQMFSNPIFTGTIGGNLYNMSIGDIQIEGGLQMNLDSSLMLSGNAQQNAFIPINVVDSAVNIPINIVVIMGDNNGTVDINNVLNSINKANITGGI